MPISVTMPRLSDTMEQGTIIRWNVKEGDEVSSGDIVADVETDKATMEMQVYDDGVMARILVDEGKQVPVGTTIAMITEEGEDPAALPDNSAGSNAEPEAAVVEDEAPAPEAGPVAEKPSAAPAAPVNTAEGGKIRVSPVARRLAEEHGVDVRNLQGTGPSGRIVKRDILAAVESAGANAQGAEESIDTAAPLAIPVVPSPAAPAAALPELSGSKHPLSGMRQTIARRLVQSKQEIPHYQVTMRFAMDALLDLRKKLNADLAEDGVKLSVNDFIVRACGLAMRDHPMFNASWATDHVVVHGRVNVGVAISLPEERGGGLVVATIRDVDSKSLRMISAESKELALKARDKGLAPEDMSDSTFTISNLGMFGVDDFTAIINPPNSAILACGAAVEQPVVRDHQLAVGWEMAATLSLDHRVIDGAMAARYLQTLKGMIEEPMRLLV